MGEDEITWSHAWRHRCTDTRIWFVFGLQKLTECCHQENAIIPLWPKLLSRYLGQHPTTDPCTHTFTHSLAHSLTHSPTHSISHAPARPLTHPPTHSLSSNNAHIATLVPLDAPPRRTHRALQMSKLPLHSAQTCRATADTGESDAYSLNDNLT